MRVFRISGMKVISAITSTSSMSKEEVDTFLENKLNLQLGSIDREKSLIITPKTTKKIKNLRNKPNISFSIDDENFPHKGVKGKGIATVVDDR